MSQFDNSTGQLIQTRNILWNYKFEYTFPSYRVHLVSCTHRPVM